MTGAWRPQVGDIVRRTVVDGLTRTRIVQYAGASGDFNPLHTDESFAVQIAGYPTVFAHGMLTMGLTGALVSSLAGPESVLRFGVRFRAQVWPGDTLTTLGTVTAIWPDSDGEIAELEVETTNQDGVVVLSGRAAVRVPA